MSKTPIRHTIDWGEPWGFQLVDPETGKVFESGKRPTWRAAVAHAVEWARQYRDSDGIRLRMTALAPDQMTLELEDISGGRAIGLVARFGSPETMTGDPS